MQLSNKLSLHIIHFKNIHPSTIVSINNLNYVLITIGGTDGPNTDIIRCSKRMLTNLKRIYTTQFNLEKKLICNYVTVS